MTKPDDKEPHHPGSVAAEDDELTLWLNRLWARNEPPERVELWQMLGRNQAARGEMIHHEDFKPGQKVDIEQANKLANEIIAAAQNDCDCVKKESSYQLAVIDRNRKASPLVRRIGPLQPKRTYALAPSGHFEAEGEEDLDQKTIFLTNMKAGFEEVKWDKQRNDRIVNEMLCLQDSIIKELRGHNQQLMTQVSDLFRQNLEAEDRKVQRDLMLERERFKIGLMKDGVRTARNLLPGIFAAAEADGAARQLPAANGNTDIAIKTYGPSPERTLIDNFLNDIEEANLSDALFGTFAEKEGKIEQTKEGIFSFAQFRILMGVHKGQLPASALDDLMPHSGSPIAIMPTQIERASDAGVSESMGLSLLELVGLRKRAQQGGAQTSQPQPSQPQP